MPNTQDTPSTSTNGPDTKPASKSTKPQSSIDQHAQGVVAAAADVVQRAKAETTSIARDVRDAAAESIDSARHYAKELSEDAGELTQEIAQQSVQIAKSIGSRTARFASMHALPLMLLGTSLGWLTWSMRSQRRAPKIEVTTRRRALSAHPPEERMTRYPNAGNKPIQAGNKLMGVRMGETGYPTDRDPG